MPAVCWSGLTLGRAGERSASHGRAIALSPPRANTTVNSAGEISRGEVNNQKQKRKRKKEREITAGGIFRYNFTLWTERRPETELQQQLRGGCSSQRQSRGGGGGGDCCRHWIQWKGVSKEQGGYSSASLFSGRATVFLCRVILRVEHFWGWKDIFHLSSRTASLSGSCCDWRRPASPVMASGKSCRQRDVLWTRGPRAGHCCTARNRVGPRTE